MHVFLVNLRNYTVREVLMKNHTRVWRNVYNTASAGDLFPYFIRQDLSS